jgi:hypothetical protein
VHVLVLDGHDHRAFTSKMRIFKVQTDEMRRRGLTVGAAAPEAFHYSVPYFPSNPLSSGLHVVNAASVPHAAFDDAAAAVAWARVFEATLRERGVDDGVTINVVPLDRQDQSARESDQIDDALARGVARCPAIPV